MSGGSTTNFAFQRFFRLSIRPKAFMAALMVVADVLSISLHSLVCLLPRNLKVSLQNRCRGVEMHIADSQPIPPASIADQAPALRTLLDPVFVFDSTKFALHHPPGTIIVSEVLVLALVVVAEVFCRIGDLLCSIGASMWDGCLVVLHILLGSLDEAVFIPLRAVAGLPSGTAYIAELCATYASAEH